MNFKLIQICNDHESVLLAQDAGIDRIMLDLETKGKNRAVVKSLIESL